jgi:hypothetical protein
LYLDLLNHRWQVAEVSLTGWRVIESSECPVRFRRSGAMRPLPEPERGGDIDELRRFLNIAREADFVLVVAWVLGALRHDGPYPILAIGGEQGSSKSTAARILRALIDPNAAPLRSEPRDERDLHVSASNGWVLGFDNLSRVPEWLSDGLCRLATGGGFATRALYSNGDETVFDSTRPIVLTGIEDLATRSDLLDRSIVISLPRIRDDDRRTESDLWSAFEEARPRILGALLTAASRALLEEQRVRLTRLPRMADFAKWVHAAEPALGWHSGTFLAAYDGNRGAANATAIEASPVGAAVLKLLHSQRRFEGTASDLLAALDRDAEPRAREARSWPKSPRAMSSALRRLAPNLRVAGLEVEFDRATDAARSRTLVLEWAETCVQTVRASLASDARDGADAKMRPLTERAYLDALVDWVEASPQLNALPSAEAEPIARGALAELGILDPRANAR